MLCPFKVLFAVTCPSEERTPMVHPKRTARSTLNLLDMLPGNISVSFCGSSKLWPITSHSRVQLAPRLSNIGQAVSLRQHGYMFACFVSVCTKSLMHFSQVKAFSSSKEGLTWKFGVCSQATRSADAQIAPRHAKGCRTAAE